MRQAARAKGEEYVNKQEFVGFSDCGCNAGFKPGVVLDPFFGSGTTGLVALKQRKNFIGIEISEEYIRIANKRLKPWIEQTGLPEFLKTEKPQNL